MGFDPILATGARKPAQRLRRVAAAVALGFAIAPALAPLALSPARSLSVDVAPASWWWGNFQSSCRGRRHGRARSSSWSRRGMATTAMVGTGSAPAASGRALLDPSPRTWKPFCAGWTRVASLPRNSTPPWFLSPAPRPLALWTHWLGTAGLSVAPVRETCLGAVGKQALHMLVGGGFGFICSFYKNSFKIFLPSSNLLRYSFKLFLPSSNLF